MGDVPGGFAGAGSGAGDNDGKVAAAGAGLGAGAGAGAGSRSRVGGGGMSRVDALRARRAELQALLYAPDAGDRALPGAQDDVATEAPRSVESSSHVGGPRPLSDIAAELARVDAELAATSSASRASVSSAASGAGSSTQGRWGDVGAEHLAAPSRPRLATEGSSSAWLAAVAEAKVATWAERAEGARRQAVADEADRAAADAGLGAFRLVPFGEDGTPATSATSAPPPSRTRLTRATTALVLGAVIAAAAIGFGIGGQLAAQRAEVAAGALASAAASAGASEEPDDRQSLSPREALAEFSRDQLAADQPPGTVSDDHFQLDTFRLLLTGSIADWTGRVYAAKDIEGEICVVLVQPDSSYAASCADPDQFARGGVQVTTDVTITIQQDEDGSESTITGVTATWPANGMTGLRFSSANTPR